MPIINGSYGDHIRLQEAEANERLLKIDAKKISFKKNILFVCLFPFFKESMLPLLLFAIMCYFIIIEPGDCAIMIMFFLLQKSVFFQEYRTVKTLQALKKLTASHCKEIRCHSTMEPI